MSASPKGLVLLKKKLSGSTQGNRVPVLPGYLGLCPEKVKNGDRKKPDVLVRPFIKWFSNKAV
jgi:hypothetical protein